MVARTERVKDVKGIAYEVLKSRIGSVLSEDPQEDEGLLNEQVLRVLLIARREENLPVDELEDKLAPFEGNEDQDDLIGHDEPDEDEKRSIKSAAIELSNTNESAKPAKGSNNKNSNKNTKKRNGKKWI